MSIIISKVQKVSGHGTTLYVYVPRSCYHILSSAILYAYLAEDVDGSVAIVYSVEQPVPEQRPVIVITAGSRIVLMPRKAMVYRVRVAKCSRVLALRIPKPFARILAINPKDYVNIVCYDGKIIIKPSLLLHQETEDSS
jgi:virulence-associated protein VagC